MQKGLVDEDLYAFDIFMDRTVRLVESARKNRVKSFSSSMTQARKAASLWETRASKSSMKFARNRVKRSSSRRSTAASAIRTLKTTWNSRTTREVTQ